MFRRFRSGLTYANAMATFAVFIALGGTTYAAATITGRDVQDGSLSGRDIKQGTLQSGDVKDGTLRRQDFLPGVLPGGLTAPLGQSEGVTGPAGQAGPAGPQGERGPAGADGKAGAPGKDGSDGKDGAPGTPGQDGAPGNDGAPGTPGTPGTNGTNGTNGTAVAYATLVGETVFDAKNIADANVDNPAQGVYCLKNLGFTFKTAVATVFGPSAATPTPGNWDRFATVYTEPAGFVNGNTLCPAGTQAEVTIYDVGQAIAAGGPPATFAAGPVTIWFDD
jgi:hypothetical protein